MDIRVFPMVRALAAGVLGVPCTGFGAAAAPAAAAADPGRALTVVIRRAPVPLEGRPGNVFLDDEEVAAALPPGVRPGRAWRLLDAQGTVLKSGGKSAYSAAGRLRLGRPGIGWYEIVFPGGPGRRAARTTAAVLHRLEAPTPQDSPICCDSATAWFARRYPGREAEAQRVFASLAALAGVNWIRDRLTWREIEPAPGRFAGETAYDRSTAVETAAGLKTLDVFHSTPAWAADGTLDGSRAWRRYPRDLRAAYRTCRALARRFHGRVFAWEPWNEGNIPSFGGHPFNEMCSYQKAAYLGFKAGDPSLVVCWNVFAGAGTPLQAEGLIRNGVRPYFDTFNIHSYRRPAGYFEQFAAARRLAEDKPLWISECGIRLRCSSPPPWGDLSRPDNLRQAEFIAQSIASSLFAGVNRHFFFILGNYIENEVQFGVLRHDFTPRPGYCALAAAGRFLAGARVIGRLAAGKAARVSGVLFRARPDGRKRDVWVLWAPGRSAGIPWSPPADVPVLGVYDFLGRPLGAPRPIRVSPAPRFVVLPPGAEAHFPGLEAPPHRGLPAKKAGGKPPVCRVVLQASIPASRIALGAQAYRLGADNRLDFDLFVYNFAPERVQGKVRFRRLPEGWRAAPRETAVSLAPQARARVRVRAAVQRLTHAALFGTWFQVEGDFGPAGTALLAFRLLADAAVLPPAERHPVKAAAVPENWRDNINHRGRMTHGPAPDGGVRFIMHFADTDPWAYPRLALPPGDRPPPGTDGLRMTVQLVRGRGTVRVQFIEKGGAAYVATVPYRTEARNPQTVVVFFRNAAWGQWSRPDPDGRLDIDRIRTILVGINSVRNSTVEMRVRGLEWVRY